MKQNVALTISSLLSIGLTTLHLTDDVLHAKEGLAPSGVVILLLIMLVMLYGTVELAGRRLGYLIMLLGGIAAAAMPFVHGMEPRATKWGFLFVWTLFALGLSGSFAAILSVHALWRSFRTRAPST